MFASHGEEEKIYPLTTIKIAEAQRKDQELKVYFKKNAPTPKEDVHFHLIEDTKVPCKNGKLIIPAGRSVGITITSNTLDTHVLERQLDP